MTLIPPDDATTVGQRMLALVQRSREASARVDELAASARAANHAWNDAAQQYADAQRALREYVTRLHGAPVADL